MNGFSETTKVEFKIVDIVFAVPSVALNVFKARTLDELVKFKNAAANMIKIARFILLPKSFLGIPPKIFFVFLNPIELWEFLLFLIALYKIIIFLALKTQQIPIFRTFL